MSNDALRYRGKVMFSNAKRRPRCKWLSWDDEGRPSCEHGPATKSGVKSSGGAEWRCSEKMCEQDARRDPEKKRELNARRIRFSAGGISFSMGLAPTPELAKTIQQLARECAPQRGAA